MPGSLYCQALLFLFNTNCSRSSQRCKFSLAKKFPIDDVIIWYFLSTPVLIGGYEYFANGYGLKAKQNKHE